MLFPGTTISIVQVNNTTQIACLLAELKPLIG